MAALFSSISLGPNRRGLCESLVLVVVLVLGIGNGAIEDEKEDEDDLVAAAPRCGLSGGEFQVVLGAQGRAGENHRAESPIPRREQRHRLDAGDPGTDRASATRSSVASTGRI
jgi:hypothetical protein